MNAGKRFVLHLYRRRRFRWFLKLPTSILSQVMLSRLQTTCGNHSFCFPLGVSSILLAINSATPHGSSAFSSSCQCVEARRFFSSFQRLYCCACCRNSYAMSKTIRACIRPSLLSSCFAISVALYLSTPALLTQSENAKAAGRYLLHSTLTSSVVTRP